MRRLTTIIPFWLVLGLLLNIAIAWTLAAGARCSPHSHAVHVSHPDAPTWLVQQYVRPGVRFAVARSVISDPDGVAIRSYADAMAERPFDPRRPDIIALFQTPPTMDEESLRLAVDDRGWPWPSMRSIHRYEVGDARELGVNNAQVEWGIQLWPTQTRERNGWSGQRVRALPLRPLWSATIANSIIYAAGLFLLMTWLKWIVPACMSFSAVGIVARGGIALTIGAAATFGIAWHSAMTLVRFGERGVDAIISPYEPTRIRSVKRGDAFAATRLAISTEGAFTAFDGSRDVPMSAVMPYWAETFEPISASAVQGTMLNTVLDARGWPMRAMRSRFEQGVFHAGPDVAYGKVISTVASGGLLGVTNVKLRPTRVIWPGFIINTLLFASVVFMLLCIPPATRRTLRRRGGRCICCGYDLRGDLAAGCSECGWNRA